MRFLISWGWRFDIPMLTIAIRVGDNVRSRSGWLAIVVILTGIEDFKMLFVKDKCPSPGKGYTGCQLLSNSIGK